MIQTSIFSGGVNLSDERKGPAGLGGMRRLQEPDGAPPPPDRTTLSTQGQALREAREAMARNRASEVRNSYAPISLQRKVLEIHSKNLVRQCWDGASPITVCSCVHYTQK